MPKTKLCAKQWIALGLSLIIAALTVGLSIICSKQVKKDSYDTAILATQKMQACMDAIKQEKINRGIEIVEEDVFETGMLGEDWNDITTTMGDLAAKRTSANPDMAAMMVFMLEEAGVQAGDYVGCNFSGSFPSFNIATICACDAIGAVPVYISSVGSSTWGSNNPGFTFPEMAKTLYDAGLISREPELVTPGGSGDTGKDMYDQELFDSIWERVESLGFNTMVEEDYETNIARRAAALDAYDISAFVAVGGNLTSLGKGDLIYLLGQGIISEEITSLNAKSGLVEYYLYNGVPSMLLLNIKKIVADYGLTFDPAELKTPGEASMYYKTEYPVWIICAGLALEMAVLIYYKKRLI